MVFASILSPIEALAQPTNVTQATSINTKWPATDVQVLGGIQQDAQGRIYLSAQFGSKAALGIFQPEGDGLTHVADKAISKDPYRATGGFQLLDGWAFMGFDDPKTQKDGQLRVFDLRSSEGMAAGPIFSFGRSGPKHLSTSSAVAVAHRKDHLLVAIASEQFTTIEFFISNGTDPSAKTFDLTRWCTWDARTAVRKTWIDKELPDYTAMHLESRGDSITINFLGHNAKGNQVVDTYTIDPDEDIFTMMSKSASVKAPGTYTQNAAQCSGFYRDADGVLWLIDARLSASGVGISRWVVR